MQRKPVFDLDHKTPFERCYFIRRRLQQDCNATVDFKITYAAILGIIQFEPYVKRNKVYRGSLMGKPCLAIANRSRLESGRSQSQ